MFRRIGPRAAALGVLLAAALTFGLAGQAGAAAHAQIQGSGSVWASNAVEQWIEDVTPNGLQVVYSAVGSAQGRQDFANGTTGFAVTDTPYLGGSDVPCTDPTDSTTCRSLAYVPLVAGGLSFPYHLVVRGHEVTNLRLSPKTLLGIFTNRITNWNDRAITRDNHGVDFPSLPITPVVHSEGAGSTYEFSGYLAHEFPAPWATFAGAGGATQYWPRQGRRQVAENGSDGVMNYISSSTANGAIGYDEYPYALAADYPVAAVENKAGYFVSPSQFDVAIALSAVTIDANGLPDLSGAWDNTDRRAYPLSSYSYLVIPTGASDPRMTTAKRQTLADYTYYAMCTGQKEAGPLGYAPLPLNLVRAGFASVGRLHDADPGVDLTHEDVANCHNPTFVAGRPDESTLRQLAPQPPACAASNSGPCGPAPYLSRPGAPRLRSVRAQRHALTVSWAPPRSDGGAQIQHYEVDATCRHRHSTSGVGVTVRGSARSTRLGGLRSCRWAVRVKADTAAGRSKPSRTVRRTIK